MTSVEEDIEMAAYGVAAEGLKVTYNMWCYKWGNVCAGHDGGYHRFAVVRRLESSVYDQLETAILGPP